MKKQSTLDVFITKVPIMKQKLKIAVLFDGVGLSRLGLENCGHECTGYELNPIAHHLSTFIGSGNCVLSDVKDVNLSEFDAIWSSPPCQDRSSARTQGNSKGDLVFMAQAFGEAALLE